MAKREVGPIWRHDYEVFVAGRNRSSLAKGVEKQVAAANAALRPDPSLKGIGVYGAFVFRRVRVGAARLPVPNRKCLGALPRRAPEAIKEGRANNARPNGTHRTKARSSLPAAASR